VEEDVSDDVTLWLAVCELVAVALLLLVIEPVAVDVDVEVCAGSRVQDRVAVKQRGLGIAS
jgi:hypothetical protein